MAAMPGTSRTRTGTRGKSHGTRHGASDGREEAVREVLGGRVEDDAQRAGANSRRIGLSARSRSRTAQEIAWQIVCEEKMIIEALETAIEKLEAGT